MAQYLILIYEAPEQYIAGGPEVYGEVMKAHNRFGEQWGAAILGGNALQGIDVATTIRGDVVTDGPFVESKEVLGGYYLVEATDLDQALEIGRSCPAPFGGVEVRPVAVFE
ncbi:MAG: YciI family protein [Lapillicoccus sp.]